MEEALVWTKLGRKKLESKKKLKSRRVGVRSWSEKMGSRKLES